MKKYINVKNNCKAKILYADIEVCEDGLKLAIEVKTELHTYSGYLNTKNEQ